MRSSRKLLAASVLSTILALAGCGDDGTGPERNVQLTPGDAPALSQVEVRGLPSDYTAAEAEITVGDVPALMVLDPVDDTHRFLVPDLPPGRVEVTIPGTTGKKPLSLTLQVLPRSYVGGTSDAAITEMNDLLDSLQVSLSLGQSLVDRNVDPEIYDRMDAALTLAEAAQRQTAALTPEDRARVAAIFSGVAPEVRSVVADIAAGVAELGAQPPLLSIRAASAPATLSATAVVTRCQSYQQTLTNLNRLSKIFGYVATAVNAASLFGGPAVRAAVGIIAAALTVSTDLAVVIANSVPALLDPHGLRLQVGPARVKHDGGTATMTAWIRRRSAGEVLGAAAGGGLDMKDVSESLRKLDEARKLVKGGVIREIIELVVKDVAIDKALEALDGIAADYLGDHILPAGEVQVTFDGVTLGGGYPSPRWEFTAPDASAARTLRTIGKNQQPVETVSFSGQVGGSSRCVATTDGSNPSLGLNGFEIATSSRIEFLAPAQGVFVEVQAGGRVSANLPVMNRGTENSGVLTYRLQYANGLPYPGRSWLAVSAPSGPGQLAASRQGTVSLSVSAAADAVPQQVVVPVAVLENGAVVDNAWLQVRVTPQLSDVVVNRASSSMRLWDHGQQDGDIVTVTLNGSSVVTAFTITNAGTTFPLQYRPGRNVLTIRALNEGSLSPNTASIALADVVRGTATQAYELPTGGSAQLVITYDPAATPSIQTRPSRVPAEPTYSRCGERNGRDCRP